MKRNIIKDSMGACKDNFTENKTNEMTYRHLVRLVQLTGLEPVPSYPGLDP